MAERTATILDGGLNGGPRTDEVAAITVDLLSEKEWETSVVRLCDLDIAPCRGCFACWVKTPGECIIDDAARDVARAVIQSELLVFLSPITFGGYSSELKKALDRLIPLLLPYFTFIGAEVHHIKRYDRYPSLLGIGLLSCSGAEQDKLFETLVHRNSINFHAPETEVCVLRENASDVRAVIGRALAEVMVR